MTLTKNFFYQGPDQPADTVVPPSLNVFKNIRKITAMADVADLLCAGVLCYLTGTTNASDMTPCVTEHGEAAAEGFICVVEIEKWTPYHAATVDKGVYPNKITNATATITNYTPAANTYITVIPLEIGMVLWVLGSTNGSFDTTFGTSYIPAANGLIKAEGQPTGASPDKRAGRFVSMATTVNQNWALVRYEGICMYDAS